MKKIIIIVGIVLVLLAGGYFIVLPNVASASASSSSQTYQTQTASTGDLSTYVSGTGNVRPKQTVVLKWQTSGTVAAVNGKQGDLVTSEKILSSLALTSLPQDVINAQVDLDTAKKNLETVLDNSLTRADQAYDSLAVFHFGNQAVEADKTRKVVISGLRTSFDEAIVVKGLYTSYPKWVEIRKWKGYVVNPWYSFQF